MIFLDMNEGKQTNDLKIWRLLVGNKSKNPDPFYVKLCLVTISPKVSQ